MNLAAASAAIQLRDLEHPEDLRACQQLQKRTWGITDDAYLIPAATMRAAQLMGGSVLGAFRGETLVGFTFAFLGRYRGGELTLYSQLAAIDPAHQGEGIGRVLKLEQRNRAKAQGVASVTWTFDPLQPRNAVFNLATLGAVAVAYEVNLHGVRSDALNLGTESDRLVVRWSTDGEPKPGAGEVPPNAVPLLITEAIPGTHSRRVVEVRREHGEVLTIEAPARLGELKAADLEAVRRWQQAYREAFGFAFETGYRATGFARQSERAFYLLTREG